MKNNKNDLFFSELAKAYAENEGISIRSEFVEGELENKLPDISGLDREMKRAVNRYRFKSYSLKALPLVASVFLLFLFYNSYFTARTPSSGNEHSASSSADKHPEAMAATELEALLLYRVELVSASLPESYTVTGVDYDNQAAIMEITNDKSNRIVLVAEEYSDFDDVGFSVININGTTAYGLVKNDYCVIKCGKDKILYTLTGRYGIDELIEISKSFL